ncbi:hypothetical protein EG68_00724 [Paragonimus skrjabini miyazakii]|uniref:F-box domain-containing protein n=1 Tax=Paragonimus skrjabini miyazakii TaxID=59628 RepID=A0A8S9Z378_9TREM|nr:hypothetical protein EG68_00724 [Paragonimus skrjabini miyazakii]
MASFAKVCIDLSNNLKNFRFTKSSTPNVAPVNHKIPSVSPNPFAVDSTVTDSTSIRNDPGRKNSNSFQAHPVVTNRKTAPPIPPRTECPPSGKGPNTDPKFVSNLAFPNVQKHTATTQMASDSTVHNCDNRTTPENLSTLKTSQMNTGNGVCHTINHQSRINAVSCVNQISHKFLVNHIAAEKPMSENVRNNMRPTPSPTMAHRVAMLTRACAHTQEVNSISYSESPRDRSNHNSASSSPLPTCRGSTVAAIKQRLLSQGLKLDLDTPVRKFRRTRYRDRMHRLVRGRTLSICGMWQDETVLENIFTNLSGNELLTICGVCKNWFRIISRHGFWDRVSVRLDIKSILGEQSTSVTNVETPNDIHLNLEYKLVQRLQVGIQRHISALLVSHLTDRYASCLKNALVTSLTSSPSQYPTGSMNSSTTLSSSFIRPLLVNPQPTSNSLMNCPNAQTQTMLPSSQLMTHSTGSVHVTESERNHSLLSFFFSSLTSNILPSGSNDSQQTIYSRVDSHMPLELTVKPTLVPPFTELILRGCSIVDSNLEQIIRLLNGLRSLELQCCNELSELALWTCLPSSVNKLSIFDCINISDESLGAVAQLLPELRQFTLQAYHVSDSALSYFSPKQRETLRTVQLIQCMDITNQGVINLVFALPNLKELSLSGCTNVTDECLDAICENLKGLSQLNLSWCSKITDNGLEYVSRSMPALRKLTLDRCVTITDIGLSYLSTKSVLQHLSLRWCINLSDGIMPHLLGMTGLTYLSLAGCKRISEEGICQLARHPRLRRLEVTHCPGASHRVKAYLAKNLPECHLLD